jgi:hypothetical protein
MQREGGECGRTAAKLVEGDRAMHEAVFEIEMAAEMRISGLPRFGSPDHRNVE